MPEKKGQTEVVTLEWAAVNAALDAAVLEKGGSFVRDGDCVYFNGDDGKEPWCIVGKVFDSLGIDEDYLLRRTREVFPDPSIRPYYDPNSTPIRSLIRSGIVRASDRVKTLLDAAQVEQDGGLSWGTAVRRARRYTAAHFDFGELSPTEEEPTEAAT